MINKERIIFTFTHIDVVFPKSDTKKLILNKLNEALNGETKSELEFDNIWMDIAFIYLFYFKFNKIEHLISSRAHLLKDTPENELIFNLIKSVVEKRFSIRLFIQALYKGNFSL